MVTDFRYRSASDQMPQYVWLKNKRYKPGYPWLRPVATIMTLEINESLGLSNERNSDFTQRKETNALVAWVEDD